ncbi:MAG: PIN domain-containing protein [Archaeoglobus sp.]|nr:PIN domain-containing protein [Archaeoglobus sp.]
MGRLRIAPFTITSARIAGEIECNLREKGENVNIMDVLIAAVVMEKDSTLVTRDEGYKQIEGLKVEFY